MELDFRGELKKLAGEQNIAARMTEQDAEKIGMHCQQGYLDDKSSRVRWEEWYAEAMKLALQVKESKSFPWPNCSNIRFPLMTIAGLNFHAKAYSGLISGTDVVKCRAIGSDPNNEKNQRAVRVGKHMSYQLLECSSWEEQTDKGLFVVAIMGCGFKKTIRDNNAKKNCSDFVMPQDLVLNYYTTDLESCPRASHRFTLTRNELRENINAGLYREPTAGLPTPPAIDPLQAARDQAQKLTPPDPSKSVHFLVEQSCLLDLDGDGYEEPYAVTFDEATGFVYRIIARYYPSDIKYAKNKKGEDTGTVLRIVAENYYTKIPFIPSPDGGFYDVGLGILLGPITESVSTLINQITDWATMSITAGGFLGRGVRMKAGEATFKPLEWKTVDSTGDDLSKNIVPLPVKELSPVLLDLLKFLVNYGERIAGSGDIQVGELPGQNVKAGTMEIANENGRLIFNAIFKRIWRAFKEEFKKFYRLNQYFQDDEEFEYGEKAFKITKADYQHPDSGIVPAADPNIVSRADRQKQADMLKAAAQSPGYDREAVEKRWLEAYEIPGWESLYDLKKFPPQPPLPMLELQLKQQREKTMEMREQTRMLDVQKKSQLAVAKLLGDLQETNAKIFELNARAAKELKEAQGVDMGHAIAMIQLQLETENKHRDRLMDMAGLLINSFKEGDDEGRISAMAKDAGDKTVLPMAMALQANGNGGVGQPPPAA